MGMKGYLSFGGALIILLPGGGLFAQEEKEYFWASGKDIHPIYSVEYFSPVDDDRNIRTINANAYWLFNKIEKFDLSFYAGFTATYADGDITQLEGSLDKGTFREVNYENSAFGLGPVLLADIRLFRNGKFAFHLNGSGGLILYNKRFPAGGDYYNFMWRAGPVFRYSLGGDQAIGIGYQWMHVSNGQGLEPKNPAYDAQGVTVLYSAAF